MPRTSAHGPASILALALAGCLAVGCGGATTVRIAEPEPPPVDEHLARVLPGGVQAAIRVDVEQLRDSLLWDAVGLVDDLEEVAGLRASTGIDPLAVVDELLLVGKAVESRDGYAAAAIKGRFDAEAVVAEIVRTGNGDPVEIRGRPGAATEDLLVLALTGRTLLAGTPAAVEEALAATFDGAPSLADDPEFLPVADSKDALTLRFRRGAVAPDFSRFGARRMPFDGLEQVAAVDARLSTGDGLSGQIVFTCPTRLDASALAKDLRATKRDLSRNPIALLLGVDWLFDKIVITAEVSAVEVRLALDENDVLQIRRLIERLEKIRELAGDHPPEDR